MLEIHSLRFVCATSPGKKNLNLNTIFKLDSELQKLGAIKG